MPTPVGALVGIGVGLTTLALNWQGIFPDDPVRQAGLVVTVSPSLLTVEPNGSARGGGRYSRRTLLA